MKSVALQIFNGQLIVKALETLDQDKMAKKLAKALEKQIVKQIVERTSYSYNSMYPK